MDIEIGDVVQISPEVNHHDGFWSGNFLIVTDVFDWGIMGYCQGQTICERHLCNGVAFIRLRNNQFKKIGKAIWTKDLVLK